MREKLKIDCHNHIGIELLSYLRKEYPYCQSLEKVVEEGGSLGIDRWIVFPFVTNLAMDPTSLRVGQIELSNGLEKVPYAFENRRLMEEVYEFFPKEGALTFPFAIFDPMREVTAQIEALRTLTETYRIYGLKTQTTIIQSPISSLEQEGRPFLDLAEELDIPLLIHSSVLPSDRWAQAQDILDIAEKHPPVRFCLAHSCRFDREGLDRVQECPNAWFDCSAHRIHCRLAVEDSAIVATKDRRFDADFSSPEKALQDLAAAYPEKLLWGSDSPYYSFVAKYEGETYSLRSTYREEVDCLNALSPDMAAQVSQKNTLKFLGIEG